MKRFVIISTYPAHGSKNIGDQLITSCLQNLVSDAISDAQFDVIWRADYWENVKKTVLEADHVFFACLALRQRMSENIYPYLQQVLDSGVPFSVVAAGTDLEVEKNDNIYEGFSDETISVLKTVNERSFFFTTRGVVTQEFCRYLRLSRATLGGDVAFYDKRFDDLKFNNNIEVKKIVVSDPHKPLDYLKPMQVLLEGLKNIFPSAEIVVAQHGLNKIVEDYCLKNSVKTVRIYEDRFNGLDIYDEADLHVGFRVHAHVSALKRRKYSYLLEQDGRGCDYGATLERKISVSNFLYPTRPVLTLKNLARFLSSRPVIYRRFASVSPVYQLLAIIREDSITGFEKFSGLEKQILSFSKINESAMRALLN